VHTNNNVADIPTKALLKDKHVKFTIGDGAMVIVVDLRLYHLSFGYADFFVS